MWKLLKFTDDLCVDTDLQRHFVLNVSVPVQRRSYR